MRKSFTNAEKDRLYSQLPNWNDDRRMHALFCEYDGRDDEEWLLHAWREYIDIAYITFFETLSSSPSELMTLFMRHGRRPIGLPKILERLYMQQELFTKEDVRQNKVNLFPNNPVSQQSVGWMQWMVNGVSFPLRYMRGGSQRQSSLSDHSEIYSASKVKLICSKLVEWGLSDPQKRLFTLDQIKEFAKESLKVKDGDLQLVLEILMNHQLAISTTLEVNETEIPCLKFLSQGELDSISHQEKATLLLDLSKKSIEHKIEDLRNRSDLMMLDIKRHLKQKKRSTAAHVLRRKKQIDQNIENLEEQAWNMSSAEMNQKIVQSLRSTVAVQKTLKIDIGEIENAMEDLQDLKDRREEVDKVLMENPDSENLDQDKDLLAELDKLDEGSSMSVTSTPKIESTVKTDQNALDALDQLTIPQHTLGDRMATSPIVIEANKESERGQGGEEEERKEMLFAQVKTAHSSEL